MDLALPSCAPATKDLVEFSVKSVCVLMLAADMVHATLLIPVNALVGRGTLVRTARES